ncbi:DNA polymerase alpha/primase associated subunit [Aulographum hederae CBS 113979]|uniref:DNA polymerase alpha subunit B n=1 Tax=Aulographum hederae CBS 113979 TaxID=1176131 RepID=A0A6G1H9N6_9PEZI|nr:DNA polymerase alpha/primase associated subunit [Aulographum hederae CBS 113979]
MEDTTEELTELFSATVLAPEVLNELQSIQRLHSISAQELFYKWESYSLRMGSEETKLDYKTVRDFKKDLNEALERDVRRKAADAKTERRVGATPRGIGGAGNVLGILDGIVPNTPRVVGTGSGMKRKVNFETPGAKVGKSRGMSSPSDLKTPGDATTATTSFEDRPDPGLIQYTINDQIPLPESTTAPSEPRIKLKANTELAKFAYKTQSMKLSSSSEVLDDRINEFLLLLQDQHGFEDGAFGNAARRSTNEIIAVGRIACDSNEGKLNTNSIVLEMSRKWGSGHRVPLNLDGVPSYQFFPGKIVALRGINASGDFFTVSEILSIPLLPPAATNASDIDAFNARVQVASSASDEDETTDSASSTPPLNIILASGPYTPDTTLDFSPFTALLSTASATHADTLILTGPFLDIEHPLLRTGDFDLPSNLPFPISPDKATLTDLFKAHFSLPLAKLCNALPTISVILIPTPRDAIAKHVAWPQDRLPKKELMLPKQVQCVTDPITLSLNEIVAGISGLDVFEQIKASEISAGTARQDGLLVRACKSVIEQRHFFPVFPPVETFSSPAAGGLKMKVEAEDGGDVDGDEEMLDVLSRPMGPMLDLTYLKLGEWLNVRPDLLVSPSVLPPFARVVENVLTINPGTLSKRRGPGTYARMTVLPVAVSEEERDIDALVPHKLWERTRVDIVKI